MYPIEPAKIDRHLMNVLGMHAVEAWGINQTMHIFYPAMMEAGDGWHVADRFAQAWSRISNESLENLVAAARAQNLSFKNTDPVQLREEILRKTVKCLLNSEKVSYTDKALHCLLRFLVEAPTSVLRTKSPSDYGMESVDNKFIFSDAFWRVWVLQHGTAPFVDVWTKGVKHNGKFLQKVKDEVEACPGGLLNYMKISDEIEAWCAKVEAAGSINYNTSMVQNRFTPAPPPAATGIIRRVEDW